jgi:hypothetical protein
VSSIDSNEAKSRCPKCDAEVASGAVACPACGLATSRFDAFASEPIDAPPDLVLAWHECGEAWDDDGAHERFRATAAAHGAFAYAAGAYRQAARERPGDARAADGLARVLRLAEAALLTRPPRAEPGRHPLRRGGLILLAMILAAAIGLVGVYMMRASRAGAPESPPASAAGRSW